jgi:hypothetical protein
MPSREDGHFAGRLALSQDSGMTDVTQEASALLRALRLLEPGDRLTEFRYQEAAGAVLSLSPGTKVRRPIQRSPIPNLLLAGAWTDTGWPANLESAIVSGERCADVVLRRQEGLQ